MLMCYELIQYELMFYIGLLQLRTLRLNALKYCVGILINVVLISIDDWWISVLFSLILKMFVIPLCCPIL